MFHNNSSVQERRRLIATIVVAALGYFVDIYDLVLFSIVRVPSLRGLGLSGADILEKGVILLNAQMAGMLLGGILWGIWGDKKGRLSVLFGSIFLYSVANIANAFVTDVTTYGVLRFVAGVGLAGELGAAITLISEIMSKEIRGYGTAVVASVGVSGAVVAALIGDYFTWQTAYLVGGGLGMALLLLRVGLLESGMFESAKGQAHVARGDMRLLFVTRERMSKYFSCILIGVPIWYVIGVVVTFSPELARELGHVEPVSAGYAIMMTYIGLVVGDLTSGLLSQLWRTRKRVVNLFLVLTALGAMGALTLRGLTARQFYAICLFMGFATGYWAVFMTVAAEQFGTNIRATVTTTAPNFVRGAVVPLTTALQLMHGHMSLVQSAIVLGLATFTMAFFASSRLPETFGKDLNYFDV
jgi:MFS family permease